MYRILAESPYENVVTNAMEALRKAGFAVKVAQFDPEKEGVIGEVLAMEDNVMHVTAPCKCSGDYVQRLAGVVPRLANEGEEHAGEWVDVLTSALLLPPVPVLSEKGSTHWFELEHAGGRVNAFLTAAKMDRYEGEPCWRVTVEVVK